MIKKRSKESVEQWDGKVKRRRARKKKSDEKRRQKIGGEEKVTKRV